MRDHHTQKLTIKKERKKRMKNEQNKKISLA